MQVGNEIVLWLRLFCGFEGLVIKYVRTYLTQLLSNIKWEGRRENLEVRIENGGEVER